MEGLLHLGQRRIGSSPQCVEDLWKFGVDHVESKSVVHRSVRGSEQYTSEGAQHFRDVGQKEEQPSLDLV